MRVGLIAILTLVLAACVTAPATPQEQAAYWGPVPDAPSPEQLASALYVAKHVWLERPDGRDYINSYPRDAWEYEVESSVILNCIILTEGRIACAAQNDGTRFDFEEAARRVTTRFRLGVPGRDVESVVGQRVDVRISFRLY